MDIDQFSTESIILDMAAEILLCYSFRDESCVMA